jgi:type VI secretion system protein
MDQALFESLTGMFLDGTPIEAVPQKSRVIFSIMDNLSRMFNSRKGCISHLKDYGLPDISEIYRKMPNGVEELRDAIRLAIEKYEPRLKNVRVVQQDENFKDAKLVFILSGEVIKGSVVRFQTTFISSGQSTISPWKKPQ